MLLGITAWSQSAAVTDPPPAIEFGPWQIIGSDEVSERYQISFPSAFKSGFAINDSVRVHTFLPTDRLGAVPVVIVLHYWGAADLSVETRFAAQLNRRRIGAVVVELPYHLSRTPAGYASGQLAIQPNTEKMKSTMIQSVSDVRRTVDWIYTRPEFVHEKLGIVGTSLGAMVASLTAAVEPRFSHWAFLLGGVDFANLLWTSSRVVSQREHMRREGYTEDRLRAELVDIEPMTYLPKAPRRPSVVVRARFDTVVPARSSQALIDSLDHPTVVNIDTGHFGGVFAERAIIRTVGEFFQSQFFGDGKSILARQLSAPTIRIGVTYDPKDRLQVTAGLDVWRADRNRSAFASVMLTPKGARAYLGIKISSTVSLGASIGTSRVTPSILWSIVL